MSESMTAVRSGSSQGLSGTAPAIRAEGLTKRYGDHQAVAGVDLEVPEGSVLGVLGPNGAGKTTTLKMLTTMALPDSGRATVAGFDVVRQPAEVRKRIGVTGQDATLDDALTGWENLTMIGQLVGLRTKAAKRRAGELLGQFELEEAASRPVKGYSGGMRRRLDLAASLMSAPPVIFLDEPTTGLDPVSRSRMWEVIRGLVSAGTTVLLTTQYLDEADNLADRIIVIDHGRIIAEGSSAELKGSLGRMGLVVNLRAPSATAAGVLAEQIGGGVDVSSDGRRLTGTVADAHGLATRLVRVLDAAGVEVDDIEIHKPSLDDVFFSLTQGTQGPETGDPR